MPVRRARNGRRAPVGVAVDLESARTPVPLTASAGTMYQAPIREAIAPLWVDRRTAMAVRPAVPLTGLTQSRLPGKAISVYVRKAARRVRPVQEGMTARLVRGEITVRRGPKASAAETAGPRVTSNVMKPSNNRREMILSGIVNLNQHKLPTQRR